MRTINDSVLVDVLRWDLEPMNLKELLMRQVTDIRKFSDEEFDVYAPMRDNTGTMWRVGIMTGLTDDDLELFKTDKSAFWNAHIHRVGAGIIENISVIWTPLNSR